MFFFDLFAAVPGEDHSALVLRYFIERGRALRSGSTQLRARLSTSVCVPGGGGDDRLMERFRYSCSASPFCHNYAASAFGANAIIATRAIIGSSTVATAITSNHNRNFGDRLYPSSSRY